MRVSIILIGLGLMLGLPTNVQAVDPDVKCEADKLKETGKYKQTPFWGISQVPIPYSVKRELPLG